VLVVDDEANVELVASDLVVAVVLLVLDFAVEDVVVALANVELVVAAVELVEPTGLTTTTPAIPCPPGPPWSLQW
jgi:hypothetical protein